MGTHFLEEVLLELKFMRVLFKHSVENASVFPEEHVNYITGKKFCVNPALVQVYHEVEFYFSSGNSSEVGDPLG